MKVPGYESLADVLKRAYDQAAIGKGAQRHATGLPFHEQPMQTISQLVGSNDGLLYQAMKKIQESQRMDRDAAVRELLGAIVYVAGAIIYEEALPKPEFVMTMGPGCAPVFHSDVLKPEGFWYCNHGVENTPHTYKVPVGEACPFCHAIK